MKTITSRQNPDVKNIVALHDAKERYAQGCFIAEGLRVITTLLESKCELLHLYTTGTMLDTATKITNESFITLVNNNVMQAISTTASPSGLLAIFKIPHEPKPEQLTSGIVLAQIADPGNMGTLIRSCAAMGFGSVVVVEGVDPWSPKVIQSCAGAIAQLKVFQYTWEQLMTKKGTLPLCALVVRNGKEPKELNLKNTLLVVGNEAKGLPQTWSDQCEQKMTIPMPGNTESLNAAIAGSIALYLMAMK